MTTAAFDTFDTLKYAKRLEAAKVSPEQAEVQSEVLREVLKERDKALAEQAQTLAAVQAQLKSQEESRKKDAEQMATKGDLRELKAELKGDIALVRKDMDALGNKLIIRLTVAIGALIGLAFAAQRYLPPPH